MTDSAPEALEHPEPYPLARRAGAPGQPSFAPVIRLGIAGWDYPDWQGVVYPRGVKGAERLAFLAALLPAVEINVTFYRPVTPRLSQNWLAAVAGRPDFRFTAKLLRSLTHDRTAAAWKDEAPVKEGLAPLLAAGRLGALLAQFPYSFHNTQENRSHLAALRRRFADWPLTVEVRHRSWQRPEVKQFFTDLQLSFCALDQPPVSYAFGAADWVTGPFAYLRLHGRNQARWFGSDSDSGSAARYDYLYPPGELRELAARGRRLAAQAAGTFLIFNNHPRGQAVANALEMLTLLGQPCPPLPASLTAAFPRLAATPPL